MKNPAKKKRPGKRPQNNPPGPNLFIVKGVTMPQRMTLEALRLHLRVNRYDLKTHGANPTCLPRVTNVDLFSALLRQAAHGVLGREELIEELTHKGCENADDLIKLEI